MFAVNSIEDGLRVTWQGEVILDYHFQTGGPRTYWHPLRFPDSPVLTMDRPGDHVHHQGMWVAWKKVNDVNFWEQSKPDGDPEGFGRIVHREVLETRADPRTALLATENAWMDWRDITHLTEIRRTVVYPPEGDHLAMDIELHFQPGDKDVKLDLSRGEPGRGGLFYSGLTIRFDNGLTPGQLLDADGRTEPMDVYGSRSRWCGFAGRHQEDGQVYGMTILDHPGNPRHPTAWWVRNAENYALIQPSLCYHQPYKLAAGGVLDLNYRVVIHRGKVNPDLIERQFWKPASSQTMQSGGRK